MLTPFPLRALRGYHALRGYRALRGPCAATLAALAFAVHAQIGAPDANPLTAVEAMALAERNAPALEARRSVIDASQAMAESARALPDPKFKLGLDNWPIESADKFSTGRDFMTMRRIGIARDMPREEKRELRAARHAIEARREAALLEDNRLAVRRDAALAWVERYYAEAAGRLIDELKREARVQYDVLVGQVRTGRATPLEAVSAQSQLRALDDRGAEFARLRARAFAQLERWLGAAAGRPLDGWTLAGASIDRAAFADSDHPHIAAFALAESQADNEIAQARAQEKGDWGWEVAYQKRGAQFTDMVSFGIVIDLPAFGEKRIAPEVRARQAQKEAAQRNRDEARRAHQLEIRLALTDWDAANARRANFDDTLLPLARERIEQASATYRGGAGKLADVLEARRQWLEVRLAQLQIELEAARAWAQMQYFTHTPHAPGAK